MNRALFETWLAPLDVGAFRHDYLSKRALFRAATAERLATVLPLRSWDIADLLRAPGAKALAWFEADDGRHLTAEVPNEAAAKLYRGGVTLYVQDVPELAPLGDEIARALKVPRPNIKCTLFCNRPGAKTRAHFDPIDTLTLQLKGRKRWRVAPNALATDPTTSWATLDGSAKKAELWLYAHGELPATMPPGAEDYLLEPGAVLHVPRGHWHETESDVESVSLHIHHVALPWVDAVLVSLRALLLRESAWREGANGLWDHDRADATEQRVEALLRELTSAAGRLSVDDVLPKPRPCPRALGPQSPLVRCARAGFVVEGEATTAATTRVTFVVADYGTERRSTVEMSRPFLDACRLFVQSPEGGPFSAAQLADLAPDLGADEAQQLVGLLLDLGFLRPALARAPDCPKVAPMSRDEYLEAWLAPLDVETFRTEYSGRRPLFREAGAARLATLAGLRTWEALDILAARAGDVRAWFEASDGRHLTAEVSPAVARKLYQAGTTFYVKELPELAPVHDSIARHLRLPADHLECGVFCNRPGAKTRPHFDPVNLFTVQLKGRKRWRLAPNRHAPDPNVGWATLDRAMRPELRLYARGPLPEGMPPGEVEEYLLGPGALLYVPRGYWHETESDEESISLHVYQLALPWVDAVLAALRAELLRDPAFRVDAQTLWDPTRRPADEATLEALLRRLRASAEGLAPDDVLPTPRPRGAPGAHEPYARRATASFLVESPPGDGGVGRVTFAAVEQGTERRTTVEMSGAYLGACEQFAGPSPPALSAGELAARVPGLAAGEALSLVALLLDVGFLRPAT